MEERGKDKTAKEGTEKGRETRSTCKAIISRTGIAPLISCRLRSLVPLGTCLEKEYEKRMHIMRDEQERLG
jgi:hypothetical protein